MKFKKALFALSVFSFGIFVLQAQTIKDFSGKDYQTKNTENFIMDLRWLISGA
jgi:hypothetical protein